MVKYGDQILDVFVEMHRALCLGLVPPTQQSFPRRLRDSHNEGCHTNSPDVCLWNSPLAFQEFRSCRGAWVDTGGWAQLDRSGGRRKWRSQVTCWASGSR